MPTLHITRGLPGAGKSTFARAWAAEDPEHRARVNRDDMRTLIHSPHAGWPTEKATTIACHSAVRAFLRKDFDVICDDTNLNAGNVKNLLQIAAQTGAAVEWHDFDVTPAEAKTRDAARPNSVGPDVIDKLSRFLVKGALPPRPSFDAAVKAAAGKPYTAIPGTPRAVVVDIDGTLAHNYGHRSFYDYTAVLHDAVHRPIVDLVWHFIDQGYEIVIMSGRDDSCRDDTVKWLAEVAGLGEKGFAGPFMRTTGDKRDDSIVKLELFDANVRDHYDVRYVLDDRNRVVAAWRSIGLTVLQVADGDF